ncbi:response regulator [Niallia taxi]|uniref:response regulator n=1 Tax=Niallia TaxID=2837506 RepID=UPI00203D7884|nr:response regulator [Niallia sp. MER 6]MCM3029920.1 response regulator [Niallia sp. MER 6]
MEVRVVIADDSLFMRTYIKNLLNNSKYKVIGEASDGCEAVSVYKELKPDILILDLTMDCMDGMTALQRIMEFDCAARIIICSAMGQSRNVTAALKHGAKDFIVKPYFERFLLTLDNIS